MELVLEVGTKAGKTVEIVLPTPITFQQPAQPMGTKAKAYTSTQLQVLQQQEEKS
jgi:hypothetical protein